MNPNAWRLAKGTCRQSFKLVASRSCLDGLQLGLALAGCPHSITGFLALNRRGWLNLGQLGRSKNGLEGVSH